MSGPAPIFGGFGSGGSTGGPPTDPDFASVVLLIDSSDNSTESDPDYTSTVVILDTQG